MAVSTIYPSGTIQNATTVMLSGKELVVQQMNIAAQNLSNGDTSGFKALIQTGIESVYTNPEKNAPSTHISYVQAGSLQRDLSQGSIRETNNPFDFAIMGQGYFAVQVGDKKQYTRDGRFRLNDKGDLVTMDGHAVLAQGGGVNIGGYNKLLVQPDGTILGVDAFDKATVMSQLFLVNFANQQAELEAIGNSFFQTTQEEIPVSKPHIIQGSLESSNTNPMAESVSLMRLMRNYKHHEKITETNDELMTQTINLRVS